MTTIPIHELDTIYLSYDEPRREEFWVRIKNEIHWAKRVDGVRGSDAAHKAAANISETERFILIDGDNMPDFTFWDQELMLTEENSKAQFRWRARNNVNGLYYGNGGLSCWTREFVWNMKTHEASDGDAATNIEFCFDRWYWPMHDCFSTTYPHHSPQQAWRAGFREGVKLCTRSGVVNRKPDEFKKWVWSSNMRTLWTWWTLGNDVENGEWAIHGARCGTHYLMLQDWDHIEVRDFDCLNKLWLTHQNDDEIIRKQITKELNSRLGLDIVDFDSRQSAAIKKNVQPLWKNTGIMSREIYD